MSKKDYILLASVIKDNVDGQKADSHRVVASADIAIYNIAQGLAVELQKENRAFDKNRFLTACGLN